MLHCCFFTSSIHNIQVQYGIFVRIKCRLLLTNLEISTRIILTISHDLHSETMEMNRTLQTSHREEGNV